MLILPQRRRINISKPNFLTQNFFCGYLSTACPVFLKLSTSHSCISPDIFIFRQFFVWFPIPFHHHLLYNSLVIQDILLCISGCKVHLHPLLFVCENFPVALKMYFLCSALSLGSMDSIPDTSAS